MGFLKEFKEFAVKGNVLDLAVAVVIGGAFGKIVSSFVSDLVMPLVNAVMPQGDWRKWEATPLHVKVGDFIGTLVDFLIVALVVFIAVVKVMGAAHRKVIPPPPPATKPCPECLENIPAAARRCRACGSALVVLALLLITHAAAAQTTPKFEFAKPDPVKTVEWKAQAKGGLLITTGNSQTANGNFTVNASRKENGNRVTFDANAAYGRSNNVVPMLDTMNMITGISRRSVVSTNSWLARGRYDRFFTANNSGFVTAQGAADRVAGKSFFGGGQVGYSRQLLKSDVQLLVAELGYDFSYERYIPQANKTLDPVSIHSARAFVGETLKVAAATGVTASVEALFNLNKEGGALDVNTGTPGVAAFKDTRVIGKLAFTTLLHKSFSAGFSFTLKYDQNPAPLPVPAGFGAVGFAPDVHLFAEKVDTLTEATLVYTFL
jgi:large conductance mechanosensitive channel